MSKSRSGRYTTQNLDADIYKKMMTTYQSLVSTLSDIMVRPVPVPGTVISSYNRKVPLKGKKNRILGSALLEKTQQELLLVQNEKTIEGLSRTNKLLWSIVPKIKTYYEMQNIFLAHCSKMKLPPVQENGCPSRTNLAILRQTIEHHTDQMKKSVEKAK